MEWRLNHVGQMAQSVQDYSSDKPALSLSFADQTWFELSSDCSDEEKEQMIKAACDIPINKSLHKKDRCGNISLP